MLQKEWCNFSPIALQSQSSSFHQKTARSKWCIQHDHMVNHFPRTFRSPLLNGARMNLFRLVSAEHSSFYKMPVQKAVIVLLKKKYRSNDRKSASHLIGTECSGLYFGLIALYTTDSFNFILTKYTFSDICSVQIASQTLGSSCIHHVVEKWMGNVLSVFIYVIKKLSMKIEAISCSDWTRHLFIKVIHVLPTNGIYQNTKTLFFNYANFIFLINFYLFPYISL